MKPLRLSISIFALCSALGVLSGCQHKKQVLVVPQQPPPTAAPSPSPTPEPAASQPAEQADQTQQTQPLAEQAKQEPAQTTQKETPKHPRKPSPRKPAGEKSTTEIARNNPNKKIIPAEKTEPTPSLPQIAPGPTPANSAHDQASTDQLLRAAESNLNGIKRQLNKDEEAMLAQIREFINQSRKATTENDPERAHNLAVKARVLSDELVKQR
jgi:hypothetical protein